MRECLGTVLEGVEFGEVTEVVAVSRCAEDEGPASAM